ncbi:sortilin (neurotensin receptor 3) [Gillisia sp. Hel_I_86]|uniref:WD40/YVTN/BNR-like repeat-containing protein n=1 Tax=Gillisia sp. Hel_I_86 TaxID=1249981 RepID=UPI00119A00D7|nr:oxidoreductase [Gillisia sp. Hel_I_86]TVZ27718.1 sortilin (neurotensin receptor 3) [Gillisia sp. Hel_I_86]
MKLYYWFGLLLIIGCNSKEKKTAPSYYTSVEVEIILEDSISVRAIELMGKNLAFATNNGIYGMYNSQKDTWKTNIQKYDTLVPEFRAVASTSTNFFMLSVANPALLYKTGDSGRMELVYKEENEKVFYDALAFWNDEEGIAMGDPVDNCLSIIITRDGGKTWNKIPCENLPAAAEGEAAFAASNSNIAIKGNKTWILSGGMKSRVFFSPDKGETWEVFDTPIIQGTPTQGGYSLDFHDENQGFIIGGDYTNPDENQANKAITKDGGKTWKLLAVGQEPGYKSSVRYVPGKNGHELIAVGFTGISYSKDAGKSWNNLSSEGFYTIRFLNDSIAYAAGKNRIAKLRFKK